MAEINVATCKKFLTENDIRASKDGIAKFRELLNKICNNLGKECARVAKENKRKTVMPSDVEKAFNDNLENIPK